MATESEEMKGQSLSHCLPLLGSGNFPIPSKSGVCPFFLKENPSQTSVLLLRRKIKAVCEWQIPLHPPPSTLHYSTPSFDDAPLRRRRRSATPPFHSSQPDPTKWGSIINQGRKFDEQRIRRQVKKLLKYERTPSTEWAAFFQTWKKILFRNGKLIYNFFIFWRTSEKRHCNFLSIVWLSSILSLDSWDREFW